MNTRRKMGLLLLACVLLTACAGRPETRYFALSAESLPAVADNNRLSLAVGPVDLPRYLERPHIVSRSSDNRLQVDEFNRWGGSLEEEIVRVLSEDLVQRLGTQRVYGYPSRIAAETDYRIALEIRAFDGPLDGEVRLLVAWSLIADRSGEVLQVRQGDYRVGAAAGYEGYVAAMSEALGRLGADIARAVSVRR